MQKQLKVLIGDNNISLGVACSEILTKGGAEVTLVAKDGIKILEAIKSVRPDVVVIEAFMANMDAIGVIQGIRKLDFALPKIIVLSGYDNQMIESQIMQGGAAYYMLKPFDMPTLSERIFSFGTPAHNLLNITSNTQVSDEPDDLESIVTDVILHIGVPAHVKGYHYIRYSIMLCIEDQNMINCVTKQLYPSVAKQFNTTPSRVERAIRHAIEIAWDRGDIDTLNSYFGYTINTGRGKPTNSEFIAMISDKLRLKLKKLIKNHNS